MTALAALLQAETRRQRRALATAALLASLTAAASVVLLGLSGWFITAAGAAGLAGPVAARSFNYMLPSAAIRFLAILRTGARYGERLASHAAAFAVLARIRPAIYRALAAAPAAEALAVTTGEATAQVVSDVGALERAVARRSARWGAGAAVTAGALLTLASGIVVAVAVVVAALATLAAASLLQRRLREPARQTRRLEGALRDMLAAQFAAAPELRCYAMESAAMGEVERLGDALGAARARQARVHGMVEAIGAGTIALGSVMVFLLARPAGAPVAALCALGAAMAIDGLAPLLRDWADTAVTAEAERRLAAVAGRAEPSAPHPLPSDWSLRLGSTATTKPDGARIAVAGRSGAGKTRLVESLLALRPAPQGAAWLGGRDVAAFAPDVLRRAFAWLPQDAQLIAGTVRDNLVLADPAVDEEAMWCALRDACLDEAISAMPYGLDSWLGEDGTRLSGGERRRLALARAYLAPAPWLLLDEPTEALDAGTEARVVARLLARLDRTGQGLVAVTHRPAMLAACTIVHELESPSADRANAA